MKLKIPVRALFRIQLIPTVKYGETDLLGRQMFRCLSVVYDEGLRSYKAVAFIESLIAIDYLKSGAPRQRTVLIKQKTLSCNSKNLGEKIYG